MRAAREKWGLPMLQKGGMSALMTNYVKAAAALENLPSINVDVYAV